MLTLTGYTTKYSIYLFSLIAIPVIFEAPTLFKLWIVHVPDYTILFTRIFLFGLILDKLTFHLGDAIRAVGDIKWFQIIESLVVLVNLPLSYFLYRQGFPPETIYVVPFLLNFGLVYIRLHFAKMKTGLVIVDYLKNIVIKSLYPLIISTIFLVPIRFLMDEGMLRLIVITSVSGFLIIASVILIGMESEEKQRFKESFILVKNYLKFRN